MTILRLTEIIEEILKDNGEVLGAKISEHTTFDQIGLSSFDLATLTVMIEDECGIDIFEDEIITSVGEIVSLTNRK
jgi:acyl carrier protein